MGYDMKKLSFLFEPDTNQKKPLLKAADKRGLEYGILEVEDFSYDGKQLLYKGMPITELPETIINRVSNGAEMPLYPRLVENGVEMINSWHTTSVCNDKLKTCRALDEIGAAQPKTLCMQGAAGYAEIAARLGTGEFVAKNRFGRRGISVFLIKNERDFAAAMEGENRNDYIFQEFIEDSAGKDLRTYVIGDKYFGSLIRKNDKDFRSSLEVGGNISLTDITEAQARESERIAQAVGGGFVSVDYLPKKDGSMLVCELNANADLEYFERFGLPIADKMIDYYIKRKQAQRMDVGKSARNTHGIEG